MSKSGDTPFDPQEFAFTIAEAATVSGTAERDIRNWMKREVVPVGKKNRMGRIMFCPMDVVRLRVIGDLNRLLGSDPSNADRAASNIAAHYLEWSQRENTHLHSNANGTRRETRLILNLGEDCNTPSIVAFEWGESAFGFKVAERGDPGDWSRHPFIVFPVEQIFLDVVNQLWAILESEED